ncbi:hypothetical protein [Mesorhizobium sp. CAU 1732]|uniref:hypothetical protein n=1 Tax=Mesorhizobium sp. CAU 1732 TaxID=3140358 RepID=UPI003260831B
MADITVPLSRTYSEAGKTLTHLVFRSPRWQDFIDLGDIEEWQPIDAPGVTDPRMMLVRHHDVIARYAERCLKDPAGPADLAVLDLVDTMKVHGAIRDFFADARQSLKSPTNSSGGSEKGSTTSGG